MLIDLPILGICGWSGSGKTTLIESIVPSLRELGLKIAVVKHTCQHFDLDRPGKDTDRFYHSGADVIGHSPDGSFHRTHDPGESAIRDILYSLIPHYDLILLEGYKDVPVHKIWLHSPTKSNIPFEIEHVLTALDFSSDRNQRFTAILQDWLPAQWIKPPVYGCVLIGGKSRRMGTPKHLIQNQGITWLENTLHQLQPLVQRTVIVGEGEIPDTLENPVRLPDVSDAKGPMAGLLSAMRWAPYVNWLVAACDLPSLSSEALQWLLSQRRPGHWAILPRLQNHDYIEPLLAYYDFRARNLIESLSRKNKYRLSDLSISPSIVSPSPPSSLEIAWKNVNSPDDYP